MSARSTKKKKPKLKIVFDGVVAVGPGHPKKSGKVDGPFFGVMGRSIRRMSDRTRRLRRPKQSGGKQSAKPGKEPPYYIPMHVPTIFTRLKPTAKSRRPDQVLQLSPWHERWYIWHPVRERLEFRFDGDGTPGPLTYLRGANVSARAHGGGTLPEGALSIHGIELVPDMRRIWTRRSMLLDGLLSADPHVNEKVLTQVLVPWGVVGGAGVLEKGKPLDVVFDPPRDQKTQEKLVPNAVVMVEAKTVEIAAYSLDSGEKLDSIQLQLTDDSEIWVSNGDPSDVEFDMNEIAIEIARHFGPKRGGGRKKQFLESLGSTFGLGNVSQTVLLEFVLEVLHGAYEFGPLGGRGGRGHYAGNLDLDFELFYSLMKNEDLAGDGKGLPVPKRPRPEDKFAGPNCLMVLCETNDRLFLKSESR
jgi:hypothetical protein